MVDLSRNRIEVQPEWRGRMTKRVWRGRVRDRVGKTFVALAGKVVSTGELVRRTWPRKQRFHREEYKRVRLAAAELADPIGRSSARGRP
jgi:hypothetical protein